MALARRDRGEAKGGSIRWFWPLAFAPGRARCSIGDRAIEPRKTCGQPRRFSERGPESQRALDRLVAKGRATGGRRRPDTGNESSVVAAGAPAWAAAIVSRLGLSSVRNDRRRHAPHLRPPRRQPAVSGCGHDLHRDRPPPRRAPEAHPGRRNRRAGALDLLAAGQGGGASRDGGRGGGQSKSSAASRPSSTGDSTTRGKPSNRSAPSSCIRETIGTRGAKGSRQSASANWRHSSRRHERHRVRPAGPARAATSR